MKKTFKRLHLWLAVPFGLIIALICFSGAMIEFAGEISEWAYHDRYEAQVSSQGRLPLPELVQRVEPHLEPGVTITGVSIPNDSTRNYEFNLSAPPRTEWLVDPYTGRVAGPKEHLPFFEVMFKLHRWLLDFPHEGEGIWWGKLIVGVSTLMFLFVLITGLVAFWPRTTRGLRKQLTIHLRRGRHRRWFDLHTIGGAYLVDGVPQVGQGGLAGDISHIPVEAAAGRPCKCGNVGCLETIASADSIRADLAAAGLVYENNAQLLAAARDGIPEVATAIRQAGTLLGHCVAHLVSFLAPQGVIVGGALSAVDAFTAGVRAALHQSCLPSIMEHLVIESSRSGREAALWGLSTLTPSKISKENRS